MVCFFCLLLLAKDKYIMMRRRRRKRFIIIIRRMGIFVIVRFYCLIAFKIYFVINNIYRSKTFCLSVTSLIMNDMSLNI